MNNDTINKVITTLDQLNTIIDNDTQKLKDLNESIKNDTRKEYIKICINELEEIKKTTDITKDMYNTLKDYTNKKSTINELQTKFNKLQTEYNQHNQKIDQIDKQRADYEKKYSFVLINGSISAFDNETWNTNKTN